LLRLFLMTVLPQLGGLVLMVGRQNRGPNALALESTRIYVLVHPISQ
jgi:hypothetical protein